MTQTTPSVAEALRAGLVLPTGEVLSLQTGNEMTHGVHIRWIPKRSCMTLSTIFHRKKEVEPTKVMQDVWYQQ